ncbi:alpha/beta hydrolase family protein [Halopelagius fulvigenes]|uniref:Alpha/beta hydrolase family protein n=1 Tax=Halopelagius fulvigenes TaxID=1198324 RepID=A0ABD5TX51_9EURY
MADQQFEFDYGEWTDHVSENTTRVCTYGGETGIAFTAWQKTFRDQLRDVLGFPVIRDNGVADLDPRRRGTSEVTGTDADYERQTWSVETERGFRVPFHLLLPSSTDPPYPVVLALHGHAQSGKDLAAGVVESDADRRRVSEERRDIARQAVERGFAAFAPDMRAFGELATHAGDGEDESADELRPCTRWQKTAQLVGRSLVGERVWDALRLVEFVERRPELDGDRVAVTGHSGGGIVALFAAALDERLAPAAPCASVSSFDRSIVSIDHCLCNYVPGVRRLGEIGDVAGLIAPRPLRVVGGDRDPIFPEEGTRRAFDRIREIYRGAEAEERCSLYVGEGGHRFYEAGVWPFLERNL